jgi:hypothetical protein
MKISGKKISENKYLKFELILSFVLMNLAFVKVETFADVCLYIGVCKGLIILE